MITASDMDVRHIRIHFENRLHKVQDQFNILLGYDDANYIIKKLLDCYHNEPQTLERLIGPEMGFDTIDKIEYLCQHIKKLMDNTDAYYAFCDMIREHHLCA